MYASPAIVGTQSSSNNLPVVLYAVLSIINRRARTGAGMPFKLDYRISVFGLTGAEAIPPYRLCHSKTNGL
jgi:hypothetical protein